MKPIISWKDYSLLIIFCGIVYYTVLYVIFFRKRNYEWKNSSVDEMNNSVEEPSSGMAASNQSDKDIAIQRKDKSDMR